MMITTDDITEFLAFAAPEGRVIGYHSSVQTASAEIEKFGFLPSKILPLADHQKLIGLAEKYKIDSFDLKNWLSMRSVTFTRSPYDAIKHIEQGSAGGQGLKNVRKIIEGLPSQLTADESAFIDTLQGKINDVCNDQPVTYIVDLTDLGPRLDPDKLQPFFYYRWHPENNLPEISEIGSERILMKLSHNVPPK